MDRPSCLVLPSGSRMAMAAAFASESAAQSENSGGFRMRCRVHGGQVDRDMHHILLLLGDARNHDVPLLRDLRGRSEDGEEECREAEERGKPIRGG